MSKQSDLVVISQIGVPAPFNPQTTAIGPGDAVTTTYAVTVASSGGANRYFIDGVAYPKLTLSRTYIYIFDLSNSTNTGHPLRFKDASGSSYSTGVVVTGTPGAAGAKVTLTVAANAPVALSYYCTVHGNAMGNTIAVTNSASLNVGANNYFDSESLTANTTVNFTSVPTTANWRYSFKPALSAGTYNVTTAIYKQNYNTYNQETEPTAIYFKPDGTKMYMTGDVGNGIYEYNLTTPWDVSTAALFHSKSVAGQEQGPHGLFFRADGLRMFVTGYVSDKVHGYVLGTAWDLSTANYVYVLDISAQESSPMGIFFKEDGVKMYIVGEGGDEVNQYTLGTAWNVETASATSVFSIASEEITPRGLAFSADGTKMYVTGSAGVDINQYTLSTAWDITTASYLQKLSLSSQDSDPRGVAFKPDGTSMYIIGQASPAVFEYTLSSKTSLTLPASVVGNTSTPSLGDKVTYTFVTTDSGSTVDLIAEEII